MKYLKKFNEGATEKAATRKDKHLEVNPDKMESMRKKVKDHIKSQGCETKQVGNDLEIHFNHEHIAQVMFRKDYIGVKKVGNKFPKEFGYEELGKIKAELSSIVKSNESQSNQKSIFTYTLLKDEEVVDIEASNMDEAGEKVVELYPGSDPMLTHVNGKLIDWKRSNF